MVTTNLDTYSSIGAGPAQNSFPPPPPPPFPLYQIPPPSSYSTMVPRVPMPSLRGFMPLMNGYWNSSIRGGFVPRPQADGSYHRYNKDPHVNKPRMPFEWVMRPLPPSNNATLVTPPQPLAPFSNPVGFDECCYIPMLPLEPFGGMPFLIQPPPPAEPNLTEKIVRQVNYYFSDANLVKDYFLRIHMDEEGWVQISLIATFNRIKSLTSDISVIVDALKTSTVVEVQGDKVRRRDNWMAWLLPPRHQVDIASTPASGLNHNSVADYEKITFESSTGSPVSNVYQSRSSAQLPNSDVIDNASPQLPSGDAIVNAD